jgi:hypothetical protein
VHSLRAFGTPRNEVAVELRVVGHQTQYVNRCETAKPL